MLWTKKDKVDENTLDNIKILQQLKANVREVKKCYSEMSKGKMANSVKEICKISDLIVKEVSLNQNKIPKINLFVRQYLPTLIKMLRQYINIKNNKLTGDNPEEIKRMVEDMLPQIQRAFQELLNQLFDSENDDVSIDVPVMMKVLNQKGLLND